MSRRRLPVAILALLALTSSALAGPAKVIVLPLDGDADPELRAKYSASVQRLARTLGGKVTTGDVTFTDTATAIGCDPKQPKCAEDVRATLGVDELIYGTVTKQDDQHVLVVHRTTKGKPPREISTTLEAGGSPERAESELAPLFGGAGEAGPGDPTAGGGEETPATPEPPVTPETPRQPVRRAQVIGYTAVGGGAVLMLISFAMWSSASGLKDDIEAHPTSDYDDILSLRDLEDTARSRAWTGNVLFLAALAAGGYGGYTLYRDRKAQHAVIAPAPVPGGAAILLRGAF
jgi:hypothetical protein